MAAEHPLTLTLGIDTDTDTDTVRGIDILRGMLGAPLEPPSEAGLLARRLSIAMARVALEDSRDVPVPRFLGRIGDGDLDGSYPALLRLIGDGAPPLA